ncbi:hypothetical protein [Faecalicatena contorta]|uniref:Uncharacterized protein n=1 Tax=Faecalicatena contorta TaxID=39482 RepID=A0A315ZYQ3_9FIRM|nr:hypothetical protein [Faecalicatena contorta]PWJ50379.1 hypothetical protein A8805_10498 [Faecalicatena contorta]SUQ13787.1 hypothetical protein SAMN05216529_10498 [Faecalicatena contorta]
MVKEMNKMRVIDLKFNKIVCKTGCLRKVGIFILHNRKLAAKAAALRRASQACQTLYSIKS